MTDDKKLRGGETTKATASAADPAAKAKRIRISAFDSMRFFLIMTIVLGHFIRFASPADFWFRFWSQHNVSVGAFFALSGYVTAYTSTENAQRAASPKLLDTPKQKWALSRIFGFYPLHLVVLALFSPLFIFVDMTYNGLIPTITHGLLSVTLTQAWFPTHAEVWNAPTWYLSALAVATALMPFGLPSIAKMTKPQLKKTLGWTWLVYFLPKLAYAYDFNAWGIFEGVAKSHPNLAAFNILRFSPLYNVAEVVLGVIACRLVMLDGASDEADAPATSTLSTLFPLAAILGTMFARAAGFEVSDMLYRSVVYVPLFLRFLMAAHRNTVKSATGGGTKDPLVSFLSNNFLVALGNLAFPIYIVHGPIGQVFYKKLVAKKIFGQVLMGPTNFAIYLAVTFASAWILQKTVLQNKSVGAWSKNTVESLSKSF